MDEIKASQSTYSAERTAVTGSESLRGEKAIAIAEGEGKDASAPKGVEEVGSPAKQAGTEESTIASSAAASTAAIRSPEIHRGGNASLLAGLGEFLKRTWVVWAVVAGTIFGGMALVTVQKGMAERARIAKEARQETAVATVTVDTLLARCGAAAEDVTKDMYPMISRTMTYIPRENERVVFQFSRTSEENSEWVFLSMKDGSGTKSYNTTQTKIAALPCLDLKK